MVGGASLPPPVRWSELVSRDQLRHCLVVQAHTEWLRVALPCGVSCEEAML